MTAKLTESDCGSFVLCPFSYSRTAFPQIPFPALFQIGISHKRNCPETGEGEVKPHFIP